MVVGVCRSPAFRVANLRALRFEQLGRLLLGVVIGPQDDRLVAGVGRQDTPLSPRIQILRSGRRDKPPIYEWTCHTEVVEAPVGAADTGPDGAHWFSRVGPDVRRCLWPIRRTTFRRRDWDS